MKKYKCACREEFKSKTMGVIHLLTLGCYDKNLEWKNTTKERKR